MDAAALSRAMQSLNTRVAKRLNAVMRRRGPVLEDRYFARPLRTPREVRNAVHYVLHNRQHHSRIAEPDFFTSDVHADAAAPATTWLLRVGWRLAAGSG